MATEVRENPRRHRYEIHLDDVLVGFATYRPADGVRIFVHTEINPAYEGHGLGSALAKAALDDVRAQGLAVVPQCPFIAAYIQQHPEYADLVATEPAEHP